MTAKYIAVVAVLHILAWSEFFHPCCASGLEVGQALGGKHRKGLGADEESDSGVKGRLDPSRRYGGRKSVLRRRDCLEITTESDPLRPDFRDFPIAPAGADQLPGKISTGPRFSEAPASLPQVRKRGIETAGAQVGDQGMGSSGTTAMPVVKGGDSTSPAKRGGGLEGVQTEAGPRGSLPSSGVMWDAMSKEWLPNEMDLSMAAARAGTGATLKMRILRMSDFNGRLQDVNKGCPFTETFPMSFYTPFVEKYSKLCAVVEDTEKDIIVGYILARVEVGTVGKFGHVSALTVRPHYRKRGIATRLMGHVEAVSASQDCLYVDLYVKDSNKNAFAYYKKLGYQTYQKVEKYYSNADAFDMRKSLPLDVKNSKMRPRN